MLNITINKLDKLIPREHKYNNDKTKVLKLDMMKKEESKNLLRM
nr:hypothetical protein [Mycoplasmopsis bovis]